MKKGFSAFWQKKRVWLLVLIGLLFFGLGVWWITAVMPTKTAPTVVVPPPTPTPALDPSILNGVLVDSSLAKKRPIAVMIENSPDARPQRGLAAADVVYEALVEGNITRFMALFQQTPPAKAGPVRSARSYYIDWLSEVDAVYVHAGGSPTALDRIRSYGIKAYPHSSEATFWREPKTGVASEHTLFADIATISQNTVSKRGWNAQSDYQSWLFKDPELAPAAAGAITVNFSGAQFQSVWSFDALKNQYNRAMAGAAHKDRDSGEQIIAKTIVVMTVQRAANAPYKDTKKESEWSMTTIGSGKVSVFRDGTRIDGNWKKASRTERTRFLDSAGAEIPLNRGKIWIEVMAPTSSVTVATTPGA